MMPSSSPSTWREMLGKNPPSKQLRRLGTSGYVSLRYVRIPWVGYHAWDTFLKIPTHHVKLLMTISCRFPRRPLLRKAIEFSASERLQWEPKANNNNHRHVLSLHKFPFPSILFHPFPLISSFFFHLLSCRILSQSPTSPTANHL